MLPGPGGVADKEFASRSMKPLLVDSRTLGEIDHITMSAAFHVVNNLGSYEQFLRKMQEYCGPDYNVRFE